MTTVADAQAIYEAGADVIGLNFYPGSPRCVDLETAATISRECPVPIVGVFVNHSVAEIQEVGAVVRLDYVQLHGEEAPQMIGQFPGSRVLRALRCKADAQAAIDYLADCRGQQCEPYAALLDAFAPDEYGGTGRVLDWNMVRQERAAFPVQRLILAGGLKPENVGEAIRTTRPDAVDTASGVEESPGRKSLPRVRDFIAAARQAWFEIDQAREKISSTEEYPR
ncbi:N-(5'-phosphoribosyl)anthranilate isomerase [Lignipirellula cremea]|uniref:N-(5'-phosphoribosyl)anthranilate isomerase n=1 Tax=Lignipirellula cremea TaxID=2528010 RepID=A0A518DTQ1_9BACT|nr:phosphoribosylanthranilate isomerase [Lignipirellula cremea]QDU95213.1 N-(5'-phosphoribosyl)anthranilate isomerase [Lignipirellula cremea]